MAAHGYKMLLNKTLYSVNLELQPVGVFPAAVALEAWQADYACRYLPPHFY